MKKVLITGANSFTGNYLGAALVRQGYHVSGLINEGKCLENQHWGNLLDQESIENALRNASPDYIFHLAAQTFVAEKDAEPFYRVNLFGTENLLKAIDNVKLNPSKILIASSANVYGSAAVGTVSEEVCPLPVNHYASSKLAMEHMVRTWYDRFPIIMTRPFNYTGSGQDVKFLIPKIVNHFLQNKTKIELGNIDVERDFSDVRDVVGAMISLARSDEQSEIFNLCSGKARSINSIISYMNELTGSQMDVSINPDFVRENEIQYLAGDPEKLRSRIGYQPQYTMEDTLSSMYRSGNKFQGA